MLLRFLTIRLVTSISAISSLSYTQYLHQAFLKLSQEYNSRLNFSSLVKRFQGMGWIDNFTTGPCKTWVMAKIRFLKYLFPYPTARGCGSGFICPDCWTVRIAEAVWSPKVQDHITAEFARTLADVTSRFVDVSESMTEVRAWRTKWT